MRIVIRKIPTAAAAQQVVFIVTYDAILQSSYRITREWSWSRILARPERNANGARRSRHSRVPSPPVYFTIPPRFSLYGQTARFGCML